MFDIGDQDERLEHLEKSITDLEKVMSDDWSKIIKFTLVALDSKISETDPVLIETESIVVIHWKSLRIKHKDMPRQILRGVILNAIYNLGKNDSKIARIIYLTASNYYPYANLGKEKYLVKTLIEELAEIAEKNAIEDWSLNENAPTLKLSTLKLNKLNFNSINIEKEELKKNLLVSIRNDSSGHGSQHGGGSSWGEHFAEKSSEGITKAFQSALEELKNVFTLNSIDVPINKFFSTFKKSLDQSLKSSFSSMVAVERRSELLWWKETLYSKSLKTSYRGLEKQFLLIVLASDLYIELPEITPVSVDFLLKDTFHLLEDNEEEISFNEFFKFISKKDNKLPLNDYLDDFKEYQGRISITNFLRLLIEEKLTVKDFENKTGVKLEDKITLGDLSVVILHDLMAQYLIPKK